MGANQSQSSAGHAVSTSGGAKICFYELLEVPREASTEDIKRAYRKKALELHPDRNFGNTENAAERFTKVQAAYEVLSDPQERTWYDDHRDAILCGTDLGDHSPGGCDRTTTTHEVLGLLKELNAKIDYSDSSKGFFNVLRTFFDSLTDEERQASLSEGSDSADYPSFGFADDDFRPGVSTFYTLWSNFATQKSFSWKDVYKYSDAPDRRTRRLMEKENKRCRDEGIREFNDAVRALVAFVKTRDPRIPSSQPNELERQKALKDVAAAQAIRSRRANQTKATTPGELPAWLRSSEPDESPSSGEEKIMNQKLEIQCMVCKKRFKSEKQFEAHEKSKKHIKAVQSIRRQMHKDAVNLEILEESAPYPSP